MRIIEKNKRTSKSRKILAAILIPAITLTSLYLGIGIFIFIDMSSYNQDIGKEFNCAREVARITIDKSMRVLRRNYNFRKLVGASEESARYCGREYAHLEFLSV